MEVLLRPAFFILLASLTKDVVHGGVQITNLNVPERVVNGSTDAVILDCDYEIKGDSSGLVVKWFFNNSPDPVYQWIHRKRPQDLGILKGKLNLNYVASDDDLERHRALEIANPTTELSGEYKCLVSTFESEDAASKTMVIYVPERTLTLSKNGDKGLVTVRCVGEGIYPKPTLSITARDNGKPETSSESESSVIAVRPARRDRAQAEEADVRVVPNNNVFDIYATVTYREEDLESPTTFDCLLRIPEANYSVGTSTVYMPKRNHAPSRWSLSWSTGILCLLATLSAHTLSN